LSGHSHSNLLYSLMFTIALIFQLKFLGLEELSDRMGRLDLVTFSLIWTISFSLIFGPLRTNKAASKIDHKGKSSARLLIGGVTILRIGMIL